MVEKYLKKMLRQCFHALSVLALGFQISCGIFSPRQSESPEVTGRVDPLNFSAIMNGTGQTFNKLRYEDLFLENTSVYYDFNSGTYPKTQLIQRLQQIQVQDTLIQVQWKTGLIWKSAGNDTLILSGMTYYIFPDGNTIVAPSDSGSSNFTVIYNGDWLISQWTDVPARIGKSFFAP
jgi:hypothetical protein